MTKFKLDGEHEIEIHAGMYTCEVYEQQFKRDIVLDLTPTSGAVPFTNAIRALWAMVKTADYKAGRETLPYNEWLATVDEVNYHEIVGAVVSEAMRGFFRTRPAAAETEQQGD